MAKKARDFINCSFSWENKGDERYKLNFGPDGLNQLRIFEIDEKKKSFYVINQLGKITWPFKYQKLEELHQKFHNREITLLPYEVDKLVPTWGNYIAGLLKYLGCDKV
jgi:hypothetical protein